MMVMMMETGLPCFPFVVAHQDLHAAYGMITLNLHLYCYETMSHHLNHCSNYHLKLTHHPPHILWLSPGPWWVLDNAIFRVFQFSLVNLSSSSFSELWKHTETVLSFSSSFSSSTQSSHCNHGNFIIMITEIMNMIINIIIVCLLIFIMFINVCLLIFIMFINVCLLIFIISHQ